MAVALSFSSPPNGADCNDKGEAKDETAKDEADTEPDGKQETHWRLGLSQLVVTAIVQKANLCCA
jgi:hypothetical protein